ncbi:hypothetical protein [Mesorhizobium sp. M0843]|uniref:IS66 family transposase n=1 Tax=Mesorhizobium sp. M0843 TaxID=2957010 RepID=UPI003334B606
MGAELAAARAKVSATEALIGHLKLQIAKLRREQYGPSAERSRRLLDQLELQLEELEATASEDDLAAEARRAGRPVSPLRAQTASEEAVPSICRVSASSSQRHVRVRLAVGRGFRSSAKT